MPLNERFAWFGVAALAATLAFTFIAEHLEWLP